MPVQSRASIRYAQALVMAAEKSGALGVLRTEAEGLADLVASSPELSAFLRNPTIPMERKLDATRSMFEGKVSPIVLRFLEMLTTKYREALLPDILQALIGLLDARDRIVRADVSSAIELSGEQEKVLRDHLEQLTGKTVQMRLSVDAAMVAGFVATVGDTVYDASLSAQLRNMHRQLVEADLRGAAQQTSAGRQS